MYGDPNVHQKKAFSVLFVRGAGNFKRKKAVHGPCRGEPEVGRASSDLTPALRFESCEELFDGIEVRAVGRQENGTRAHRIPLWRPSESPPHDRTVSGRLPVKFGDGLLN
jgi:hypothetical protein